MEVVIAAASRRRLVWSELPAPARQQVEAIAGGKVVSASSQPGGFSPGLASRLRLANGRRAFAKAISNDWPVEAGFHRSEAIVAAHLPGTVPAPRLWGSFDDGEWVGMVFDDIDGREPAQPCDEAELARILSALACLADGATPSPVAVARDHPRLGGWNHVARDDASVRRLPLLSHWAADHLALVLDLERDGLHAARGESLVHFDLYPHNVLLSAERVYFVDWPHARRGNPLVDLVSVLSTVAVTGADPSPLAQAHPLMRNVDAHVLDALIAAHAGFHVAGALSPATPGLDPVVDAKRALADAFLSWLARRSPVAA
jgi:hypothetical protein